MRVRTVDLPGHQNQLISIYPHDGIILALLKTRCVKSSDFAPP